jgi:cell wall assembly regulator SMI1
LVLSGDLLDDLKARWIVQRAPIVEHLRPGLSEAEIDAITMPLGVRLAREARTWWSWHDGVVETRESGAASRYLGPADFEFLPLAEAAQLYLTLREAANIAAEGSTEQRRSTETDAERHWPRKWFPILFPNRYDVIVCDTVPASSSSPVFR